MSNFPDRSLRDEDWNAVKKTLDILQESQHLVTHAQQAICPVNGFANEWSKLSDAHEAIKEAWYMIEDRSKSIRNHQNNSNKLEP